MLSYLETFISLFSAIHDRQTSANDLNKDLELELEFSMENDF